MFDSVDYWRENVDLTFEVYHNHKFDKKLQVSYLKNYKFYKPNR